MTDRALIDRLARFKGKQIIVCIDEIEAITGPLGYSVNVMDPLFNGASIDSESKRLNIRTDKESVITSFTIG